MAGEWTRQEVRRSGRICNFGALFLTDTTTPGVLLRAVGQPWAHLQQLRFHQAVGLQVPRGQVPGPGAEFPKAAAAAP